MTAKDWIVQAFLKCGQMRPGYTPNVDMLGAALTQFQAMFDAWNSERTLNYTMPDYVFPILGPGHGTTGNGQTWGGTGFQIGPTALDFVAPRPVSIPRMNLLMTSASPTEPIRIPLSQISMEEWTSISVIQLTPINVTTTFAYDPQFPNGVIWVWPPLNGNSLEIFTWGQLTPPATITTPVAFPPGYWDAIVWTLAERIWPYVTNDIMPHKFNFQYIAGQALGARQKIKAVNAPSPRVRSDFRGGCGRMATGSSDWDLLFTGRPY